MQKWEYLFVITANEGKSDGDPQEILLINGRKEVFAQTPTRWEIAERYGEQGWELVAFDFEPYWKMVFKRPKP